MPNLATKSAARNNMIHGFRFLITHHTQVGLLKTMPEPSIPSPATLMETEPEKNRTLAGAAVFHNSLAPRTGEEPRNIAP